MDKDKLFQRAISLVITMRESEDRYNDFLKRKDDPLFPKPLFKKEAEMLERRRREWNNWFKKYGKVFYPDTQEALEHRAFLVRARSLALELKCYEQAVTVRNIKSGALYDGYEYALYEWKEIAKLLTEEETKELLRWATEQVEKDPSLYEVYFDNLDINDE